MVGEDKINDKNWWSEVLPFGVALAILVSFFLFIVIFVPVGNADTINVILTTFITWIGAIIGFYFGQKPVRDLTGDVKTLTRENTQLKRKNKEKTATHVDTNIFLKSLESKPAPFKVEDAELSKLRELIRKIDEQVKEEILE